ncbi:MAG TPA: DUF6265 family protein [Bacteroidia bacterium]|jgi:hypothetical protein
MKTTLILFSILTFNFVSAQVKLTENTLQADTSIKRGISISDFSFITEYWQGKGFGEKCEELWMPAIGEQMHGTFRLQGNNKLSFAEFMTISKDSLGYVLKVVHFNPDFSTWEEKDKTTDFRFIKAEKNTAWFSGLTFRLNERNELIIYLALKEEGKEFYEEKFVFRKSTL